MRRLVLALTLAVSSLAVLPSLAFASDTCVTCGSGSSNGCQQCRLPGGDNQANRKECEKKGCKITGTASCSSAANVKVCKAETASSEPTAQLQTQECSAVN